MADYTDAIRFGWTSADLEESHAYLIPAVDRGLADLEPSRTSIFDLGCGNGAVTEYLGRRGFSVVGVDPAEDGIAQARRRFPNLRVSVGSAYDNLVESYGIFDVVVSLEVVEHLYYPHIFARTAFQLLRPGGRVIISTPYHGWLKNVAIALAGKWDHHHHPLRDHGHIKFWSRHSLAELLSGAGFEQLSFRGVGRMPLLAKSMICIGAKAKGSDAVT